MTKTSPDRDPLNAQGALTALEDPGAVHAVAIFGWMPIPVAAVVGGVIVAFVTGNPLALVGVAIGGTLAGVAAFVALFTVGSILAGKVGERVADVVLLLNYVVPIAAVLAVAVVASGFVQFAWVVRAITPVLGFAVLFGMAVFALTARSRS
jgi:hypothetical protein